jgi:L-2-hydroxyglutarate oxidase LhgO
MGIEILEGERANKYDRTFEKKYIREHQAETKKCGKVYEANDKAAMEKLHEEMKQCSNSETFKEESIKKLEHFKKNMPEHAKEIEKSIKQMRAE